MSTATAITRLARTPSSRAVSESIDEARMCRPIVVRSSRTNRSTRQTAATTTATIVILRMSTFPIVTGRLRYASDDAIFPSDPNQIRAMFSSRKATANVATSMTAGDCPRSGRKTSRSMSGREHEHDRQAESDPRPDGPAPVGSERKRERAGHDQLPVGEVDESQDAEDQPDSDGHERVDRTEGDTVGERLPVDVEDADSHEK